MKKNLINLERCKYLFYTTSEGLLLWNVDVGNKVKKHQIAGCLKKGKYFVVTIEKVQYFVHRILYQLYHNVTLTESQQIDHIDHNTKNNKKENLRVCTASENQMNRRLQENNKLGIKNVQIVWRGDYKSYYIRIQKDGKFYKKQLSAYKYTIEQVIEIRNKMLREIHRDFACMK